MARESGGEIAVLHAIAFIGAGFFMAYAVAWFWPADRKEARRIMLPAAFAAFAAAGIVLSQGSLHRLAAYFERPAQYRALRRDHPLDSGALDRLWGIYKARPDLQKAYDVRAKTFAMDLVQWAASRYAVEYSKEDGPLAEEYSSRYVRLFDGLRSPAPELPDSYREIERGAPADSGALKRLWDVYSARPDLQRAFDVRSRTFPRDLLEWAATRYALEYSKEDAEHSKDYAARYARLFDAVNSRKRPGP